MRYLFVIGIAFILDLIFGDPYWLLHPVCIIGKAISALEKMLRKIVKNELFAGTVLVLVISGLAFFVPFLILYLANTLNYYLAMGIEIYFCYQIFAVKSLKKESMKVYYPLKEGNYPEARKYLSYIVGRDTQNLDAKGITKATVETIAENTTDGVVAPLFYMAIGGAPLAFLYKAINTMDSMIGYRNEKYEKFGKVAARLDDIANFIPARITALLMIAASALNGLDYKNAFRMFLRDRKNHKSPNSAQTESVCAGALNVQLAGNAYYFGQLVHKPTIGDNNREIVAQDIVLTNKLMYTTSVLAVIAAMIVRGCIWWMI
ncbi:MULTISPECIES: adenosylcobinamide-phosphate synthase CbiB [Clostridia]|jgi:adenosylcobinamide-phosphate synthase|uniref:Cobalamin biosynthesis protein CobD n=5 Tax=Clostridia TaxID=186801 RepID=A0A4U7J8F0_9FIRM|nr:MULTISPECIES: adenosylcobinamide-phosphate synthase CbiB [Clostridia]ODM26431.1 cobalamin biosynthesis protein CobD [Clostridium sp. Bc-iso-3]AEV70053.1 cobalamin biosynthesis protein CobD [Acetivibrio clariflavus DSM 19732]KAE9628075.1 cobalamin biosynthesis protein CobD [Defluviitalea raffinosedens]MBM7686759.1 adenosylcobinamide-phosphate synthase [Defluviitalea raffinosedens]QNU66367.1 cobalamin biosynthesis protein CobD [Ruminiclostridium herbifermentans]